MLAAGDEFIMPVYRIGYWDYNVKVVHASAQVIRFQVRCGEQEMLLEKRLMIRNRFKWKLLDANFKFLCEDAGRKLNLVFWHLDDVLDEKPRFDRSSVR